MMNRSTRRWKQHWKYYKTFHLMNLHSCDDRKTKLQKKVIAFNTHQPSHEPKQQKEQQK